MHSHQSYPNITTVVTGIILLSIIVPSRPPGIGVWVKIVKCTLGYYNFHNYHARVFRVCKYKPSSWHLNRYHAQPPILPQHKHYNFFLGHCKRIVLMSIIVTSNHTRVYTLLPLIALHGYHKTTVFTLVLGSGGIHNLLVYSQYNTLLHNPSHHMYSVQL